MSTSSGCGVLGLVSLVSDCGSGEEASSSSSVCDVAPSLLSSSASSSSSEELGKSDRVKSKSPAARTMKRVLFSTY